MTSLSGRRPILIHLIGCGGTGSHLATRLVQLNTTLLALGHPGLHVVMFDPDIVSPANIGRQMFHEPDIGLPKVTVLVTRINQCTGFDWEGIPVVYPARYSDSPQIVITAVDTAKARVMIGRALHRNAHALYWIDCGNMQRQGQVIFGSLGKKRQPKNLKVKTIDRLPTVLDFYPELAEGEDDHQGPSCSLAEAIEQQDLFINPLVALEASEMLWKALRYGYLEYSAAYISLDPRSTRVLPIDPKIWRRFGYGARKPSRKTRTKEKKQ